MSLSACQALTTLVDHLLAGDDPARVLGELERAGTAATGAVFGLLLARRLAEAGADEARWERELELLCSRAGVTPPLPAAPAPEPATVLERLRQRLLAANPAAMLMLTWTSLARMGGCERVTDEVKEAIAALTAEGLLKQHWRFYPEGTDEDFEIDDEEAAEAIAAGTVVHPETGVEVPITETNFLPHWSRAA